MDHYDLNDNNAKNGGNIYIYIYIYIYIDFRCGLNFASYYTHIMWAHGPLLKKKQECRNRCNEVKNQNLNLV